jgi:hypothetical protein
MENTVDITAEQVTEKSVAELQQEAQEVFEKNKQICGDKLNALLEEYGLRLEVETIISPRGIVPRIYFEAATAK